MTPPALPEGPASIAGGAEAGLRPTPPAPQSPTGLKVGAPPPAPRASIADGAQGGGSAPCPPRLNRRRGLIYPAASSPRAASRLGA